MADRTRRRHYLGSNVMLHIAHYLGNFSQTRNFGRSNVIQEVIFLNCVPEVPISNLGWVTGYSEGSFCDFLQSFKVDVGIVPQIRARPPFLLSFAIYYSLMILPFSIVRCDFLTTSLIKPGIT
jgi:hypothetical protein